MILNLLIERISCEIKTPFLKNGFLLKLFCIFLWFPESVISLTDQIKPSGSDLTSGSIGRKFCALTSFEPNFMKI